MARAADDGRDEYRTALAHLHGEGVPKDARKAFLWMERSAEQGYVEAEYALGVALRDGIGVSRDDERALKWLRIAAQTGDPRAQLDVGRMYVSGKGGPIDLIKGYGWLALAAAQGVAGAAEARDAAFIAMTPAEAAQAKAEIRRILGNEVPPDPAPAAAVPR